MSTKRIYLATSWKNPYYQDYLADLVRAGYEVYDFRDPNYKFTWVGVDPNVKDWPPRHYAYTIKNHPECQRGFKRDYEALEWCDTVIALHPFGKSASWELGWATGAKKKTILHFPYGTTLGGDPELMFAGSDYITHSAIQLFEVLKY